MTGRIAVRQVPGPCQCGARHWTVFCTVPGCRLVHRCSGGMFMLWGTWAEAITRAGLHVAMHRDEHVARVLARYEPELADLEGA